MRETKEGPQSCKASSDSKPQPKPSSIAFILPTYGQFDYAAIAAKSFFEHTPNGYLYLLDDCSPAWTDAVAKTILAGLPADRCYTYHYEKNGGLTRSWNYGLRLARDAKVDYVIAGNSDIVFTPRYYESLILCCETYGGMAGPLSNAPGQTAGDKQNIKKYIPDYHLTDDPRYLAELSERLLRDARDRFVFSKTGVNGFFQFASLKAWWRFPFSDRDVYNPADIMVRQEDRLMGRWRSHDVPSVVCVGSFIFHYRSVSRHKRFRKRGWMRLDGTKDRL